MSERRPSILCVIETVGRGGGAEQLLASLLPEMRRQGADVEVAALLDWPEDLGREMERDGVPVHRLDLRGHWSLIDGVRKLRKLVRERRPDVFWGHMYYGNLYALLAQRLAGRGRLVLSLHSEGYATAPPRRLRDKAVVALERIVLAGADARVAVSGAVRDDYAKFFGWSDILVAHNGVDWDRLDACLSGETGAVRRDFGYDEQDFLIVTPARYVPKKGHKILLDAIGRLREFDGFEPKLFLCGTGNLREAIANEVEARGLKGQVTVSGVIAHERLLPLLAAADAIVIPSLREPFGIAAAEAMALGAPCVLSDVDGLRELTAGADCAIMVRPADSKALAEAIMRLRSDPALGAALGGRARQHVRDHFGIAACARRWIELIEGAAGLRSNASAQRGIFW